MNSQWIQLLRSFRSKKRNFLRLGEAMASQPEVEAFTCNTPPFCFNQTGLNQVKSEQSFHHSMAFCRDPLELKRGFGRMKDGIICTRHGIRIEAVPAARVGGPKVSAARFHSAITKALFMLHAPGHA